MVKAKMHLQENAYLTLNFGSRSHKMFSSARQIIWSMRLQNLKLLRLTVQEMMYLLENTLFDLKIKVTQTVALSTLYIMWPIHLHGLGVATSHC